MFRLFKSTPVYIKIWRNKVEITNLLSGESITRVAINSFSTTRNVVGSFGYAEELVRSMLKELGIKTVGLDHLRRSFSKW